jgi:hypothetical protein
MQKLKVIKDFDYWEDGRTPLKLNFQTINFRGMDQIKYNNIKSQE